MGKVAFFYLLLVMGVFFSSCCQVILKRKALEKKRSVFSQILSGRVLFAYFVFFSATMINVYSMREGVQLKDLPILESLGYVFVPILSYMRLGESVSRKTVVSILLICCGVFVFYLRW